MGVTGGRRRPLGVVTGLALSFTFATVALVYVIDALGLPDDIARTLAIVVLADVRDCAAGAADRRPHRGLRVAHRSRARALPRRGVRVGLRRRRQPRPRLRALRRADPGRGDHGLRRPGLHRRAAGGGAQLRARVGAGAVRAAAGRPPARRPARPDPRPGADGDGRADDLRGRADGDRCRLRFQTAIADELPAFLVNPTGELEERSAVASELAAVSAHGGGAEEAGAGELDRGLDLPRWGWRRTSPAPSRGSTPRTAAGAADGGAARPGGPDRLLDLHLHQLHPHLPPPEGVGQRVPRRRPHHRRRPHAGVPVRARRRATSPTRSSRTGSRYPVVQDNEFGTWSAYGNQYWPAKYLIDAEGQVRYVHFGEGEYETTERAIRTLLREKGDDELGSRGPGQRRDRRTPPPARPRPTSARPAPRAGSTAPSAGGPATSEPGAAPARARGSFSYGGSWQVSARRRHRRARGRRSTPSSRPRRCSWCWARPARPARVEVLLDGEPIGAGSPARTWRRRGDVTGQRLYRLVDLPGPPAATASSSASSPASAATPSPSASAGHCDGSPGRAPGTGTRTPMDDRGSRNSSGERSARSRSAPASTAPRRAPTAATHAAPSRASSASPPR